MRNIRVVLEYDGTHFQGFQRQKRSRTIQGELEKALSRILGSRTHVIPAGRTDSGVHARGQVVHFLTRSKIPLTNLLRALNSYLPEDLAVRNAELAAPDFHARYKAKRKIYSYRLLTAPVRSPLSRLYACHTTYPLSLARMRKGAMLLCGKHNFRSFQARADGRNSVRTLYRVDVKKQSPWIVLTFEGDGFLYYMVRNMVGTLLWLGRGKLTLAQFRKILEAKDRSLAGPTAPARGLTLEKVTYESG